MYTIVASGSLKMSMKEFFKSLDSYENLLLSWSFSTSSNIFICLIIVCFWHFPATGWGWFVCFGWMVSSSLSSHHHLLALSVPALLSYLIFWDTDIDNADVFIGNPTYLNFLPNCWLFHTLSQLSYLGHYFIHLLPLSLVYQLSHYLWVLVLSYELKYQTE